MNIKATLSTLWFKMQDPFGSAKKRRLIEIISRPFYFEQTYQELQVAFADQITEPERIVRAAVQYPSGTIFSALSPAKHGEIIFFMALQKKAGIRNTRHQGFVTSHGQFVSRKKALAIALAANQIIKKHPSFKELYSEDMW